MDTRAFERIAAPFGVGSLDFMLLRDEYTRTIAPARAPAAETDSVRRLTPSSTSGSVATE